MYKVIVDYFCTEIAGVIKVDALIIANSVLRIYRYMLGTCNVKSYLQENEESIRLSYVMQ